MRKITLIPLIITGLTTLGMAAAPTAPINAGAYGFTDTTARISFKDMSNNETQFRFEHVQDGNSILTTLTPEDTNLSDLYEYITLTNLTPNTLYTIDIIAENADGDSTPLRKSFRTLPTPNTPAQPTNLGAYNETPYSIRLSFLDNANNETGFKIYDHKTNTLLTTLPAHQGSGEYVYANFTGLATCSLYTIDLVAFNADGESEKSQKSGMTTGCMTAEDIPLPPSNVGVYNITSDSARVSFLDNSNNEGNPVLDGFIIYNNDTNDTLASLPRNRYNQEYQYTNLTGLIPDTLYTIKVVSKNAAGEGAAALKSFHTLPLPE